MADDMDIDIDLGEEPDMAEYQATLSQNQTQPAEEAQVANGVPEAYNDDFDADIPAREKIHLRGLDKFNPEELKAYLIEVYHANAHKRIEWVNDTSANIIYHHPDHAKEALAAFSAVEVSSIPTIQLRPARPLSTKPDVELFVRQALISDKKVKDARLHSKFYLKNPEYDPELREHKPRYDRRGGRNDDRYDGRNGGRREREEAPPKPFNEDMYDDNVGAEQSAARPRSEIRSRSRRRTDSREHGNSREYGSQREYGRSREYGNSRRDGNSRDYGDSRENGNLKRKQPEEDLFAKRDNGRLRDRSRSPARGEDGRYGFDDDQPQRKTARRRSRTPVSRRAQPEDNVGKELLPHKITAANTPITASNAGIELLPDHVAKRDRERFPHKTPHSNHRRSDALDYQETANIMSPQHDTRSLADRITGGPAQTNGSDFSFKGAADSPGYVIRGTADRQINPRVKELFPDKTGNNAGKELLPHKARGRGGERRRADEFF